jgi:hypothetical protein
MKLNEIFDFQIYHALLEDKLEFISARQGSALVARAEKDTSYKGEKDPKAILVKLQTADPTKSKNLQYIVNMYIKALFKIEDLSRLRDDLETFEKVKNKLSKKDLNAYKSLEELYDAIEPFQNTPQEASKKELSRAVKSGADAIIDEPDFKVIIPRTEAASKLYGKGTKWCTSADKDCLFNHYNDQGDLYILMAKVNGKNRKFQFHYETESFMNERDAPVSQADIDALSKLPEYKKFLNYLIKKHYTHHLS